MTTIKFKNHFASVIAVAFFCFIAFGSGDDKKSSSSSDSSSSSSNEEVHRKMGEEIAVGHFTYRVDGTKFMKTIGNEFSSKTADGVFLIIKVSLANNDKEEHTIDNSMFKLTDAKGTEYESSTEGETALEMSGSETLFLKQCNPNITKSGLLIFEVPKQGSYNLHLSGGFWDGSTAVVEL
jgi:Domain of unknown function (DUF4352)